MNETENHETSTESPATSSDLKIIPTLKAANLGTSIETDFGQGFIFNSPEGKPLSFPIFPTTSILSLAEQAQERYNLSAETDVTEFLLSLIRQKASGEIKVAHFVEFADDAAEDDAVACGWELLFSDLSTARLWQYHNGSFEYALEPLTPELFSAAMSQPCES